MVDIEKTRKLVMDYRFCFGEKAASSSVSRLSHQNKKGKTPASPFSAADMRYAFHGSLGS